MTKIHLTDGIIKCRITKFYVKPSESRDMQEGNFSSCKSSMDQESICGMRNAPNAGKHTKHLILTSLMHSTVDAIIEF